MYEERVRAFIAVDVEDPLLVSTLERLKETLVSTRVPMKPVETQNIHLTLRFLGEIPRGRVGEVVEGVLRGISEPRFKIKLQGLGAFPSTARPRVVWVGVSEGADRLERLYRLIEGGLRRLGFPPEKEGFSPHITLARVKGTRNLTALSRLIAEYSEYEVGVALVDSVRLKKSTLTRKGPIYETLWEVKLA